MPSRILDGGLGVKRLGNSSVTFHVIERTATLHEQLLDEDALDRP